MKFKRKSKRLIHESYTGSFSSPTKNFPPRNKKCITDENSTQLKRFSLWVRSLSLYYSIIALNLYPEYENNALELFMSGENEYTKGDFWEAALFIASAFIFRFVACILYSLPLLIFRIALSPYVYIRNLAQRPFAIQLARACAPW